MSYKEIAEQILNIAPQIDKNRLYRILDNYNIEEKVSIYESSNNYELLEMYLSTKALENLSEGTLKNYRLMLIRLFQNVDKHVTRMSILDLRRYLSMHKWKSSTLSTNIYAIRSFYNWMKNEDIIIKSEADKLKAPKPEKLLPKAISTYELEIVRNVCNDKTYRERAIVEMLFSTGARLSEITRLNIDDINFTSKRICLYGKGKKERTVFISDSTIFHLKRYLTNRKDNCPALFVTEKGVTRRLCNRSIQKIIENIKGKANINTRLHCHVFRHTIATTMAQKNIEIPKIQKFLGHSSADTTARYAHVTVDQLQAEYNRAV